MVSIFSKSKLLNCSPSGASVETNIATISRTAHEQHIYIIYSLYCESHLLEIETEKLCGDAQLPSLISVLAPGKEELWRAVPAWDHYLYQSNTAARVTCTT